MDNVDEQWCLPAEDERHVIRRKLVIQFMNSDEIIISRYLYQAVNFILNVQHLPSLQWICIHVGLRFHRLVAKVEQNRVIALKCLTFEM